MYLSSSRLVKRERASVSLILCERFGNPLQAFGQSFTSRFDENRDFFRYRSLNAHILPTYAETSKVPPA